MRSNFFLAEGRKWLHKFLLHPLMKMCTVSIIVWISLGLLPSLFLCRGRPNPNKPCCPSLRRKESLDPISCFGQSRKLERKSVHYGSWSLTISYLILFLSVLLIIWIFQRLAVIILPSLFKHFLKEAGRKQRKDL